MYKINGTDLVVMALNGAMNLKSNRKVINDLNVFPIPDGDTGDNMFMTIDAGCSQARELTRGTPTVAEAAEALSQGMLLGARGNSGVILSRIFAGISRGFVGVAEASVADFARAMSCGVEEAYKAVNEPVEGTILTVMKDAAKVANDKRSDSFEDCFAALLPEMEQSLDHTPDLLPVLREAGVVDSGGAGLLCIFRGMSDAVRGEMAPDDMADGADEARKPAVNLNAFTADSELTYGYCTEFLLRLQKAKVDLDSFDVKEITDYLSANGDSVVAFRDDTIVKVHVHTKTPGDILSHCQRWGEFLTLKIENMTLQHHETTVRNAFSKPKKTLGVVAVAMGKGLEDAFAEAGADFVISGGQTMNPSARSFIEAFESVDADTVVVFPNNSNIILTARQAAEMYDKSEVVVLPSKTMGEGYVAIASLDKASKDIAAVVRDAEEAMAGVVCGMVTQATRDTRLNGFSIRKDDFLGIAGGDIKAVAATPSDAAAELCDAIDAGSRDVALIFSGESVSPDDAEALAERLRTQYPRTEFMLTEGGQPVYNYMIVLC